MEISVDLSIGVPVGHVLIILYSIFLILVLLGLIYLVSLPFTWRKRKTIRQVTIDFGKTYFWVAVVTNILSPENWFGLEKYLQIRPHDILLSIMIFISVICIFVGLMLLHPIFMWSPMSFLMHHFRETEEDEDKTYEKKPTFIEQGIFDLESENAGSLIDLLISNANTRIPFLITMVFVLPVAVEWEEKIFRNGTNNWIEGIIRSIIFGMAHFLTGFVPLGAALALSLAGVFLTQVYMTQGLDAAVTQHLAYDSVILLVAIIDIPLSFLASKVSSSFESEILET